MNLLWAVILLGADIYRAPTGNYPVLSSAGNVWVYFTDKGFRDERQVPLLLRCSVNPPDALALERRSVALEEFGDFDDLPVYERYVATIQDMGGVLRQKSSWLNAASFLLTPELVESVARLPFVYEVKPVTSRWEPTGESYWSLPTPEEKRPARSEDTTEFKNLYGLAYAQNRMLGVPEANAMGITGAGVRLGLLDTGLKRRHPAVKGIRVVGEHDFLSGDRFYLSEAEQPSNARAIQGPAMGLIESPVTFWSRETCNVIFVADTARSAIPVRALYRIFSTDDGATWSNPELLTVPDLVFSAVHSPAVCGRNDCWYVVWQTSRRLENEPWVGYGYFRNNVWQGARQLQQFAQAPDICLSGDSLYLVAVHPESLLWFNTASIAGGTPVWGVSDIKIPPDGAPFREMVKEPQIVRTDGGALMVLVTGWRTGRIYLYRSDDGGNTFRELTSPAVAAAEKARLWYAGGQLHLVYKDNSAEPIVRLIYQKSNDGERWDRVVVADSLLGITSFDFSAVPEPKITYESEGRIFVRKSTDSGQNWSLVAVLGTTDFACAPRWLDGQRVIWFEKGDADTDVEPGDSLRFGSNQADHGTRMASIIGGWRRGHMVGVAPGVEFLVAKTEFHTFRSATVGYEFLIEEDNYIAGLEWAERNGASIISSSLGYTGWYGPDDFDGRTAPISVAVSKAVKRGVLVVTAMGNRDTSRVRWEDPYIVAPGDAFDVITVGGVEKDSSLWRTPGGGGTGRGPTADGRHKPDLVAMGDSVTVVAPDSTGNYYEGSSGTSSATALIAGCCALLKEAYPDWSASQIRDTLFAYASQANAPDDSFGHGIPNVAAILRKHPPRTQGIVRDNLGAPFPNPFVGGTNSVIYFPIELAQPTSYAQLSIFTLAGELLDTVTLKKGGEPGKNKNALTAPGRYADRGYLERIGSCWDGRNWKGEAVGSGLYYAVLRTSNGRAVRTFALVR